MADGAQFQIDIGVAGASSAEAAAATIDKLASRLTAQSEAAAAASAAMKAGEASYAAAEATFDKASKALEKITLAADAQRDKMKKAMDAGDAASFWKAAAAAENLKARQTEAAAAAERAKAAMVSEASSLDKLRTAAASAADAEKKTIDALAAAKKVVDEKKKADAASNEMNEKVGGSLAKLGGPLGTVGSRVFAVKSAFDKLSQALGSGGIWAVAAAGIAAVVAGLAAAAAAAATAYTKVAIWAVGLADAARTSSLLAQGIARSVKGGEQLEAAVGSLAKRVPLTTDDLMQMAEGLAKTGLTGKALTDTLERNAVAAAKLKFGPDFARQMLSLDQQSKTLKANLTSIFSGLKIDKLLEALSTLGGLFDEDMASAKAIKVVFESLFQPAIDGATGLIPRIRSAFIQFEILVLKALIAIKPWGSTIVKVGEVIAGLAALVVGVLGVALAAVIANVALLAVGFGALVAAATAVAAAIAYSAYQVYQFGASIVQAVTGGVDWLIAKFHEVVDFLSGLSLAEIGAQLIQGLVNGITSGAGAVVDAVKGAATGAISAAKKALGIASPSKVFAEIGGFTAEGFAGGVEQAAPAAQSALESMVDPAPAAAAAAAPSPPAPSAPAAAPAEKGGGGGLSGVTININGIEGAGDIVPAMISALEQFAAQAGAATVG